MPRRSHYSIAEVVTVLDDLCHSIEDRADLGKLSFPPDLLAEMTRRADDAVARQVARARCILSWWRAVSDDDGDVEE